VGNSAGKLIKMRLDVLNASEANQIHVFNNTTIAGDVIGRSSIIILGYTFAVVLIYTVPNIGFERIKIIFFSLAYFWDCITFGVSLFIKQDYYYVEEEETEMAYESVNYPPQELQFQKRGVGKAFETDDGKRITYLELLDDEIFPQPLPIETGHHGMLDNSPVASVLHTSLTKSAPTLRQPDIQAKKSKFYIRKAAASMSNSAVAYPSRTGTVNEEWESEPVFESSAELLHTSIPRNRPETNTTDSNSLTTLPELKSDETETDVEEERPTGVEDGGGDDPEEDLDDKSRCCQCKNLRQFFGISLLWTTTLHLLVNALVAAFVAIVLRFDIADSNTNGPVNRNTFCGGGFTSLLVLQAISDTTRLCGSFIYQGVLTKMRPYTFYTSLHMSMILVSMISFSFTYFDLPSVVGNIILSYLNVVAYLVTNYDNVIIGAIVPTSIIGFSFAVQGVSIQLIGFIPVGLAQLIKVAKIPQWVVTTILTSYIFFCLVYSFFYVKFQKQALIKLDDPKNQEDTGCFQKTLDNVLDKMMAK